jgi:hypothetical protein
MSNNKWEKSNETQYEIERCFSNWSQQSKMLDAQGRLSSFASDFFGYRWITLSKNFNYTYTEKVNVTYAVETTYKTEAKVNGVGDIDIETRAEDKTYDYPVDVEHSGDSSTSVSWKIKFVSDKRDVVKRYEEEMARDKNFTYFVYSLKNRKRPSFILYLLNFIFDFSTALLLLFALIQMIVYPLIESFMDYFFESTITLPFKVENLRFNSTLPIAVLIAFLIILGLNQLIKKNINDSYRVIVPVMIAGVLAVILGYLNYFLATNETLMNLYENTDWFKFIVTIVGLALIVFIPVLSVKYIYYSIFKTRYFVALRKYRKQAKGQQMAKSGAFKRLNSMYQIILFYSGVSLNKVDFSFFDDNDISVSY